VYDSDVRCPPAFELLIFDNDGVLVDSAPHATRVTAALLTECGWPMTPQDCFGMFLDPSLASVRARAGSLKPPRENTAG
jgi:beta-phosphoglucomutase-like phosphatase (HAD superfamily)